MGAGYVGMECLGPLAAMTMMKIGIKGPCNPAEAYRQTTFLRAM